MAMVKMGQQKIDIKDWEIGTNYFLLNKCVTKNARFSVKFDVNSTDDDRVTRTAHSVPG